MDNPIYKRVLLKLSGEALSGEDGFGINSDVLATIAKEIKSISDLGVEIGIVVGGGNFWRGRLGVGMDRSTADYMGMTATVINALGLQDALEAIDIPTRVQTSIEMRQIAEPYVRRKAIRHLEKNRVVIFAAGTGNPYFTTDTTASLRAAEINAEVILLAKNIDGVYNKDPKTFEDAKKYKELSFLDIINQGLKVMDITAATLCMENNIPIKVFKLDKNQNILKVILGKSIGTSIGK